MLLEEQVTAITQFEEIEAWKTARQLTNMVYALSNKEGFNRDFGLRDQIRLSTMEFLTKQ
jgi:23S rRNA-intervening sequence protein